ncbi:MAG: putative DNA-binding domain-containing protein [Methylotetracoccus sp.]
MPDTTGLPHFQQLQFALGAHIREPDRNPPPVGMSPAAAGLYRELLYYNVQSFLASSFPILRATLDDSRWHRLVDGFFREHRARSPYFAEVGEEFLSFLQQRTSAEDEPPFLLELAHYEWVELALMISEDEPPPESQDLITDPWHRRIRLSALAWPLAYRFPVQRIGPEHQPVEPPARPTLLLVYRGRDDIVRFLELAPLAYRLVDQLHQHGTAVVGELVTELLEESGDALAREHAIELVRELAGRGVIGLG